MPGIVGPANFPIRHPEDPKQTNGRNVNPVRYIECGGLDGPGKWGAGSAKKNDMKVEKPTSVRAAVDTANTGDDT